MIQRILMILDAINEGDHMDSGFDMMGIFGNGWWMWLMMFGGIIIVPLLTIWTYQDAKKYSENAALWALIVFLTMGIGIIFYALIRNANRHILTTNSYTSPPESQISQNKFSNPMTSLPKQYEYKSNYNTKGGFCEQCGAPLAMGDLFCSNCGTAVEKG